MTYSYTTSSTFTRVHARYIASKVAADLRQMQLLYGKPFSSEIDDYMEELIVLLALGYLASVDYGFRRDGKFILSLSFTVASDGTLIADDRAGRIPAGVNISGATWYSYLRKNYKWSGLSDDERSRIEQSLPIKREGHPEPQYGAGTFTEDKVYSANGTGVKRRTFRPL
jgi:Bacterial HORMA domain family 1